LNSSPNPGFPEFASNEIQKLWFATQKKEWSSLAILPAAPGLSVVPLAKALARAGETYLERPVRLILAEGTDLNSASRIIIEMSSQLGHGNCVVVALDSIIQNAAGIPIALAADACLLGVQLKQTGFAQANRTVEMVGASRFVGVVTLPPPKKQAPSTPPAKSIRAAPKVSSPPVLSQKSPSLSPPPPPQKPSATASQKALSTPPQKSSGASSQKPLTIPPQKPD